MSEPQQERSPRAPCEVQLQKALSSFCWLESCLYPFSVKLKPQAGWSGSPLRFLINHIRAVQTAEATADELSYGAELL